VQISSFHTLFMDLSNLRMKVNGCLVTAGWARTMILNWLNWKVSIGSTRKC